MEHRGFVKAGCYPICLETLYQPRFENHRARAGPLNSPRPNGKSRPGAAFTTLVGGDGFEPPAFSV